MVVEEELAVSSASLRQASSAQAVLTAPRGSNMAPRGSSTAPQVDMVVVVVSAASSAVLLVALTANNTATRTTDTARRASLARTPVLHQARSMHHRASSRTLVPTPHPRHRSPTELRRMVKARTALQHQGITKASMLATTKAPLNIQARKVTAGKRTVKAHLPVNNKATAASSMAKARRRHPTVAASSSTVAHHLASPRPTRRTSSTRLLRISKAAMANKAVRVNTHHPAKAATANNRRSTNSTAMARTASSTMAVVRLRRISLTAARAKASMAAAKAAMVGLRSQAGEKRVYAREDLWFV
jgi:hypothetical protein